MLTHTCAAAIRSGDLLYESAFCFALPKKNVVDPPHDISAEQAALGAMLTSAAAQETVRQALSPDDFYRQAHHIIFKIIVEMMRQGEPVDPITVNSKLAANGKTGVTGGAPYLHTLMAAVPTAASAGYYAVLVRQHAVRRRLIEAGTRIIQIGTSGDAELGSLTERAVQEVEQVRDSGLGTELSALTYREFLEQGENQPEYDWVVPGLLERGDRLVLTGTSGMGKSTLARQFSVQAAAGIHPFGGKQFEAARVFLLDCENGAGHIRRKLRPLIHQAAMAGQPVLEHNLWIESRVDGIDLALDKDVSWLLRQIAAIAPDLFVVGPLYRLAPRALNDDSDVAPILSTLNLIRAKGSCVLLEAHHGHGGDMRPRGSSALTNFPEFGLGMRWSADPQAQVVRTADLVHWRGDRDERQWPRALQAGGTWPWSAYQALLQPEDSWE
jgi:hypothetical protein